MFDYDEFRLQLGPLVGKPDTWSLEILACERADYIGRKAEVLPSVKRSQLVRLRTRAGWPKLDELVNAGREVWNSLLRPVKDACLACLAVAKARNRGLRLVVILAGQEADQPPPDSVYISELPIEALCDEAPEFVAPRPRTPVSRSFKLPVLKPEKISLPMRILVVVSAPNELPPEALRDEQRTIEEAAQALVKAGVPVQMEILRPGTKEKLIRRLDEQSFQAVHFIAHGNFDVAGDDPTPRAFICLDDGQGYVDPLDARSLDLLLKDAGVMLVVISAYSSAKAATDQSPLSRSAL
jgi:hypothetical protein